MAEQDDAEEQDDVVDVEEEEQEDDEMLKRMRRDKTLHLFGMYWLLFFIQFQICSGNGYR